MNFEFSDEQNLLREQARGFLAKYSSLEKVREILEAEAGHDSELWRGVADLGWTATVIPECYGGLGLSYLELCVIAEELGRSLAPIPFASSVYLATEALLLAGSEEQKQTYLPCLADGSKIGCIAVAETIGHGSESSIEARVVDGCLSGTKVPVADGLIANFAIVFAKEGANDKEFNAYLVDLADIEREPLNSLDPNRPQARIHFDRVPAERLGNKGRGWSILQAIYDRAAVLIAWEQVGGAHQAMEMAKDYALQRYAFGRPIGSFQAIKHKLANAYVKNTLARSNCYYGSWALASDADQLPVAAATARVSASQAYYYSAKENIQTHGGIGFTWELDCHLYYRRSKVLATTIGAELVWREKLIAALAAEREN